MSRINNPPEGVTGVLIVGTQHFVQLLESDRASVSRCFARIMCDPRHDNTQIISTGEVPHRLFPEHGMQRIDLSAIPKTVLDRNLVNGAFRPCWLPQAALEQLCRELSDKEGGQPLLFAPPRPARARC